MRAVDLFAGAGGFSSGAAMANCRVVWAANHWREAVDIHQANHPDAEHACQDLHQTDWSTVPRHDILLASPACQGHTHARGKERPHHDATRSTAWAVVSALEYHRTEKAVIENVKEFLQWALFPAWRQALEALGYSLSINIIDAADRGVPQHRERMFIVLTRSKNPIELKLEPREHVPAISVIDFGSGNWSKIYKPGRSPATIARYLRGSAAFGQRFIMPYYGSGSGLTGRCLLRPIGTITTKARWALVDGDRMRMLTVNENRDFMGFEKHYILPKAADAATKMLGNAVCPPVARDVIEAIRRAA
jgi:DNA (cytosine-5)-methyltransferase 1